MTDLSLLADRCEREGPSRDLDKAILRALGFTWRGMAYWSADDKTMWQGPTQFTSSLDAAVTLVPADDIWDVTSTGSAWCMPQDLGEQSIGRGQTPALALCVAALRARSATLKAGG